MADQRTRRSAGTILMAIGLVLILAVAGYMAWTELEAAQVRAALRQNAVAAQAVATEPAPVAVAPTEAPTEAPTAVPTAVATEAPPATVPPADAPDVAAAAVAAAIPTDSGATPVPPTPRATATRRPATVAPPAAAAPPAEAPDPIAPVRMVFPIANLTIDTQVEPMGWEVVQTANGPVSQWVIPRDIAGHHIDSAAIGQGENIVLSGHNNIYAQVFKPISLAWDNDRRTAVDDYTDRSDILNGLPIRLYGSDGKEYTYEVTEFYRLKDTGVPQQQRLENARFMRPAGEERLTIVTCWPPSNNTHRLIVIAKPAQPAQ